MISKYKIHVCLALAGLALAAPAFADSYSDMSSDKVTTVSDKKTGASFKSSDLIGLSVENPSGEKLGKVDDLAVDLTRGKLVHVIVGVGGMMKIGTTYVAVPPSALRVDSTRKVLLLDSTEEKLKSAPSFTSDQWNDFYHTDRWKDSSKFFGNREILTSNPDYVQKASKITGLSVRNPQDEKVGSVENLLIDLDARKVVALVISSGGFLGIGDNLSAVPPRLVTYNSAHDGLQLDVTKEALKNAPHFTNTTWPDLSQPTFADQVDHAFHKDVARSDKDMNDMSDKDAMADNTARNKRDRDAQSLTPMNQSNDARDLKITQQIRKAIVENKALSSTAQNVKVITMGGHVTLRGPVQTAEEKRTIGEIASSVAAPTNVDNQLEVKKGTSLTGTE